MKTEFFFAPCPRGLEAVLADELSALGAADAQVAQGGVAFTGPFELALRANLHSRVATRILWRQAEFSYGSEEDVYRIAHGLDWPARFDVVRTIAVKVTGKGCRLKSLEFVTLRIKDAVCDRFRAVSGARPSVDTRTPDVRIHAFLEEKSGAIYLDTSGEALFKRGWRRNPVDAPLKENLAAGILLLTGWQPGTALLDPMCGGGTFLVEAAQMALNYAPGLGRSFAIENFRDFDAPLWARLRRDAESSRAPVSALSIYGTDSDGAAIRAARKNIESAGLAGAITLDQREFAGSAAPASSGILVANPPYGVRIGEEAELAALYPVWGDTLKRGFAGWTAHFLTADLRLAKLIGLSASKRTVLYNGALECRLFEFRVVSGSMRK